MQYRTIISPLFIFMMALVVLEVFFRLPFVIYTLNDPSSGHLNTLHFFSIYRPADVMTLGLLLVAIAFIMIVSTNLITPMRMHIPVRMEVPDVPATIRVISILVSGAAILSIGMLGADALLNSLSSKRSDLTERGILWLLVKVANFNHLIILLLYLRYLKHGKRLDQFLLVIAFLSLAGVSLVFSQRAILISLVLELFYAALLFGRIRFWAIAKVVGAIGVVVIGISALRPGEDFGNTFELVLEGLRRAMMSRYFFDFTKLGTVMQWADGQPWLGPAAIGFVFEPFFGNEVIFYKEVGPLISAEVYLYRSETGVTPGLLLESLLSFGYLLGFLFFLLIIQMFRLIELRLFRPTSSSLAATVVPIFVLSKFTLALNSSLGAYAFQLVLEGTMLWLILLLLGGFHRARPVTGAVPSQFRTPA